MKLKIFRMSDSPLNRLIFNKYIKRGGKKLLKAAHLSFNQWGLVASRTFRLAREPAFNGLLKEISRGAPIQPDELLPYLCMEALHDRLWVGYCLAEAFYTAGNSKQAQEFIQRIWNLSGENEKYLPLFVAIHVALDDIDSIRNAYKAIGFKKALEGDVAATLECFNIWQYAYATHKKLDEYYYDFDVLDRITQLAKPHAFPSLKQPPCHNRKVRLAYLMFGMKHLNSVIVKNSLTFSRFHDSSKFDVTFFVPDQTTSILERKEAVENIRRIEQDGWKVVLAPDSFSEVDSLHKIAKAIFDIQPDILVTNAGLADFQHFYITALKPASLIVGLCQGPPPQFIAPSFDWAISWTRHPLIDCPTNCTLVNGSVELSTRDLSIEEAKSQFGIQEHELVVMSCGRDFKFQNQEFWESITDTLRTHLNVVYVVVGLAVPPKFIGQLVTPEIAKRVRIMGRVKDFASVLSMADIVVDTYPSGGGMAIVDAMALGVPVISFRNDYMRMFSQTDWSPAEEFMGVSDLLVARGDFARLRALLSQLLTDVGYRRQMSQVCKNRIRETCGNPEKMVRDCEAVYLNLIKSNTQTNKS